MVFRIGRLSGTCLNLGRLQRNSALQGLLLIEWDMLGCWNQIPAAFRWDNRIGCAHRRFMRFYACVRGILQMMTRDSKP